MNPLVSVIIPTKNSEVYIQACLESLKCQTYKPIELILVDNYSTDRTRLIASKFADIVIEFGPERSAQVNQGVLVSHGDYVFRVDSDFVLDSQVVSQCVREAQRGFGAVVVHNTPSAEVSRLAKLRKFEVDMYKYDLTHSAARFIRKDVYLRVGGYNPTITAGEDYDLQNRLNRLGVNTGFVDAEAIHMGEPVDLLSVLHKYLVYGKDFTNFVSANPDKAASQLGPLRLIYFKKWRAFVRHPLLGFELLVYHFMRFLSAGAGYLGARLSSLYRVPDKAP